MFHTFRLREFFNGIWTWNLVLNPFLYYFAQRKPFTPTLNFQFNYIKPLNTVSPPPLAIEFYIKITKMRNKISTFEKLFNERTEKKREQFLVQVIFLNKNNFFLSYHKI